jgi:hypothetical protein
MYNVYQTAVEVLIWLGEADETSDLAMDTISRIQKVIRTIGDHLKIFLEPPHDMVVELITPAGTAVPIPSVGQIGTRT